MADIRRHPDIGFYIPVRRGGGPSRFSRVVSAALLNRFLLHCALSLSVSLPLSLCVVCVCEGNYAAEVVCVLCESSVKTHTPSHKQIKNQQ